MTWCRTFACSLLLLASVTLLGAQPAPLDEGVRLFREGRFAEALVKLEQAHRSAPRNATIENLMGITETQLGHIAAADNHYRNAIRLDPAQAAPHRNLGFNLLNQKEFAGAELELREASRLAPNDNFSHYYLLLLALATGHDAEAQAQATLAGSLLDNDAEAAAGVIEAEIRTGRVDEAASRIDQLEKTGKISPAREYQLATLLSKNAFYPQAVHCFRRIASLDPSWENRYNLALALLYDGQSIETSALLAALHTERLANADVLMFLGSAFEMQQKMPEALEAYRAAAVADPSNPDRTLDYTRLLMDMDRYDEAIQAVQTGLGETSATAPLQMRLGAVEMVKGNYAAARDAFHAALAADPELDAAYVGLAQTYARAANDAEAMRILEAARAKRPGRYLLEYYFGLLASRLGREQEATAALEKAAQLEPNAIDPFYELGKLYVAQQSWPQARQAMERVIELNPQFVPAHYQLSHIYAHLDLSAKAEQEARHTRALIDEQREQALRKQRERGASFQPQTSQTPAP
ncbi:MAG: tetratricopeptide repeat protein [Terracidiphilus sp.]|nr:tetratricopeptide repeat protein [Terracidiphilus sp.]